MNEAVSPDENPDAEDIDIGTGGPDTSTVYVPEMMAMTRRLKESDAEVPLWLITFTDVMALMLTFFVLLYSMSVPEEDKWEDISAALSSEFQENYSKPYSSGPVNAIQIDKVNASRALDLPYLQGIIEDILVHEKIENVLVVQKKDGLIVSLPDALLFGETPADLQEEGKRVLFLIGGSMSRVKNRIDIIGHADPALAQSAAGSYVSGWELSLARAGAVASFFREAGYSRPLVLHGFSSARYDDLPGSMSEDERVDLSRRVDILITKEGGKIRTLLDIQ